MKYIIFDIDGVLADPSHRLHYLKDKNYEKFYADEEVSQDEVTENGDTIIQILYESESAEIILVTGRNEVCRKATQKWIIDNYDIYVELFMRPKNDYRPAHEVKEDLIKKTYRLRKYPFRF